MDLPTFARLHQHRAPRIAWFLGAGSSAAAGVATAGQMTWDFKALVFATERAIPLGSLDIADHSARRRIQTYFDGLGSCPREDSDAEYGFYFEHAYPAARDRRAYIDAATASGRPGYAHLALGALIAIGKIGIIWTTNFDRVVEDAAAQILGTTHGLSVASLSNPSIASESIRDERWPLLGKIHGDYQSDALKNIAPELQTQDGELRAALRSSASRFGLAVVGYSGRDESVMKALRDGLDEPTPYPSGIFWFARGTSDVRPAVSDFLEEARRRGIDAHLVLYTSLDELFGVVLVPFVLPSPVIAALEAAKPPVRTSPFHIPAMTNGVFPVLRLNGLLLEEYPGSARRIDCEIGGTAEVQKALRAVGADAVAHRRNDGVIAYGLDAELEQAYSPYRIRARDLAAVDPINGPPSDLGLIYDALLLALTRDRPLVISDRQRKIAVDRASVGDPLLDGLRAAAGDLTGTVRGTTLGWCEAVSISLEAHLGRVWLIFEPTVWVERGTDAQRVVSADFVRERMARRYNQTANRLFEAWAHLLGGPNERVAFGIDAAVGMDAGFRVSAITAFTRES